MVHTCLQVRQRIRLHDVISDESCETGVAHTHSPDLATGNTTHAVEEPASLVVVGERERRLRGRQEERVLTSVCVQSVDGVGGCFSVEDEADARVDDETLRLEV